MTYTNSISCFGDSFLIEVIAEGCTKFPLLKIMSFWSSVRYTDFFLYLCEEGRKEIILENYLWQRFLCICYRSRFLCIFGRKKGRKDNHFGLYIKTTDSCVYVSPYLQIYPCPLNVSFSEIGWLFLNSQGFFVYFKWAVLYIFKILLVRDIIFLSIFLFQADIT